MRNDAEDAFDLCDDVVRTWIHIAVARETVLVPAAMYTRQSAIRLLQRSCYIAAVVLMTRCLKRFWQIFSSCSVPIFTLAIKCIVSSWGHETDRQTDGSLLRCLMPFMSGENINPDHSSFTSLDASRWIQVAGSKISERLPVNPALAHLCWREYSDGRISGVAENFQQGGASICSIPFCPFPFSCPDKNTGTSARFYA